MADRLGCEDWDSEDDIPNQDDLYLRAHKEHFVRGKWQPSAILRERPQEGCGMSTDWSKYGAPQLTRLGTKTENAANYAVWKFNVGEVRAIEELRVAHDPVCTKDEQNRAHTLVHGVRRRPERIRTSLFRASTEGIALDDPVEYQR